VENAHDVDPAFDSTIEDDVACLAERTAIIAEFFAQAAHRRIERQGLQSIAKLNEVTPSLRGAPPIIREGSYFI